MDAQQIGGGVAPQNSEAHLFALGLHQAGDYFPAFRRL